MGESPIGTAIEKRILRRVSLAPYTTFKIGGPAQFFIEPESVAQFKESIEWALEKNLPYFVLGGGANILIHDTGYRGLIISTGKLNRIEVKATTVTAECGAAVNEIVDVSFHHQLTGVEFAADLPGTIGGALFMNARAYEGEFSRIVQKVHALKVGKDSVTETLLSKDDIGFSYKKSIFQERVFYIYRVWLRLTEGDLREIEANIDRNRKKRREAGQFAYPNAGCIFKNNDVTGKTTGKIIDELGLKGERIGDAEVYRRHGNFIINRGSATSEDVYRLIRLIEETVYRKTGYKLEREINLLGNWDEV